MNMYKALLLFSILIAAPTICFAQSEVGTSVVDGKTVELLSNFTWKYKEERQDSCQSVKYTVAFCGAGRLWQSTPPTGDAAAAYKHDDANYGEFIVEQFGSKQGLALDAMRKIVVDNAASAAGIKAADVDILSDEAVSVDGHNGETLVYKVTIEHIPCLFLNTVVITDIYTMQIITYSVSSDISEAKRLHADFIGQTRLGQ